MLGGCVKYSLLTRSREGAKELRRKKFADFLYLFFAASRLRVRPHPFRTIHLPATMPIRDLLVGAMIQQRSTPTL
jgi:hypothetical protein